MKKYWPLRLHQVSRQPVLSPSPTLAVQPDSLATDFDRWRWELLNQNQDRGWQDELKSYLVPCDVSKDVDLVEWWQVCANGHFSPCTYNSCPQTNQRQFPTLARIALDVLPAQASSVPCERLFSSAKLVATNLRSRLGAERFEEIQLLKWHWRSSLPDLAQINSDQEYTLDDLNELLLVDKLAGEWDQSWQGSGFSDDL